MLSVAAASRCVSLTPGHRPFAAQGRVLVFIVCAVTAGGLAGVVRPAGGGRTVVRSHARARGWGAVPWAERSVISRVLGHDDPAFAIRRDGGEFVATNPRQRLGFAIERGALVLRSGAVRFGLSFAGVSRATRYVPAPAARTSATANRVVLNRGVVSEWYLNGPFGVEQGFTLRKRPLGALAGAPVGLTLRLSGPVRAALEGRTTLTLSAPGMTRVRYSGLSATDARGHRLDAWLTLIPGGMRIVVDDARATYPITIDPFLQQASLVASDVDSMNDLGFSIAASGTTIAVGAPQAFGQLSRTGAVYVFDEPAAGWPGQATETAKLTVSTGQPNDYLGWSVAISGNTIVAGAPFADPGSNSSQGAAYVFSRGPSGWTPVATLVAGDGQANDAFGSSVAIAGNTIAVGAPSIPVRPLFDHSGPGAAYVFVNGGSGWTQAAKLSPSDPQTDGALGSSVAISSDGATVAAGEPDDPLNGSSTSGGAAYVFVKPGSVWSNENQTAKLTASDSSIDAALGNAIAISGDGNTIVAGAELAPTGATDPGAVYVFVKPSTVWINRTESAKLVASDGCCVVGGSVAISGATIIASGLDTAERGAAYTFREPAAGWASMTQTGKLTPSDSLPHDGFGQSVSIAGATIAVGNGGGKAYVFGAVPAVTSLSLSPAVPNGRDGWYVSPVHATVTASDDISPVFETRCALDPPGPAPAAFALLGPGCPFTGSGGDITGDGVHTLYAASSDLFDIDGPAAAATVKVDRTAPTVACQARPTLLLGKPIEITATVSDATSGPASALVAAPAHVSTPGRKSVALTGLDNAGNATTVNCPFSVLFPRIRAGFTWSGNGFQAYYVFAHMYMSHVPAGGQIAISCAGGGCPFARHTVRAPTSRLVCQRHHTHCRRQPAPALNTIGLEPLFSGRHLAAGDRLTFTVTRRQTIGEVWTVTILPNKQTPRETGPKCLAPGSSKPGKGC